MNTCKMKISAVSLLLGLLLVLAGCAAKTQIFLEPMQISEPLHQAPAATLYFQPLRNNFAEKQSGLGSHSIGGKSIKIVSDYAALTDSFNALLQKKMNGKGWQVGLINDWDLTAEGLAALAVKKGQVLSGELEKLTISADTGTSRTNTTYDLEAEVVLVYGKIPELEISRRTIEMEQSTIKVSFSQKTMNELLDAFVEDVAQRVIAESATLGR